jgi:hypothetical protein
MGLSAERQMARLERLLRALKAKEIPTPDQHRVKAPQVAPQVADDHPCAPRQAAA